MLPHVDSPAPEMTSDSVRQRNANYEYVVNLSVLASRKEMNAYITRLVVFQVAHGVLAEETVVILLGDGMKLKSMTLSLRARG